MNTNINIACRLFAVFSLAAALLLGGCDSSQTASNYQTMPAEPARRTDLAERINREALVQLEQGEFEEAETLLKRALEADVTFGPAHNNLGKAYYHQKKYYLAAWEFQYAIKLMPHLPEPRNNLGLVMEAVGKLDEAVSHYAQASNLEPDNPQILGNLARAHIRRGDRDADTRALLSELILRDTRPAWVAWARQKLALMDVTPPAQEP